MPQIFFHGTRGSFPTSARTHARYGGHTSCVSVLHDNQWFIFDAGSGLIDADKIIHGQDIDRCHLFLSHLHLDHICGLPAFRLAWDPNFEINFYCGMSREYSGGMEEALGNIFKSPYFPINWAAFPSRRTYKDFIAGESLQLNDKVSLDTIRLEHPGGSCGYKLNINHKSIVYLSDTSHGQGAFERFIKFSESCDLLIYDSSYCNSEFERVADYGHSTWQVACDLAHQASVKQLALFHHSPEHTDEFIDALESQAKLRFPGAFAAACGMSLKI